MTDKQPDALAADHAEQPLEMVGRWYMVNRCGVAMLCEDQRDAEKEAKAADMDWPRSGPHRAVQLVEAQAASAELRRLHAYCQELESHLILDCMTHVQNPAENEHVAGDVSKNGAESNMTGSAMLASHGQAPAQAAPQQEAQHLAQALTDPENQPNQYGVEFGMSGTHMHFKIGNQLFKLAYEPDEQEEFDFMKRMLVNAFTTFTHDVKTAPQPSPTAQADSQPAQVPTSATGGDWTQPTTVALRLGDAMQLLCGGKRPPDDMVQQWLDNTSESLQEFAASNGPAWAQGIGLIDAAMVMVDQPTEIRTIDNPDRGHEHRAARAPADSVLEDAARLEFEMQHGSAIAAARKQGGV